MPFAVPARDRSRLAGVHPDLVRVIERAADLCPRPFIVVEGLRSIEAQRENVRRGASKTMRSRHLKAGNGYGHAVDLVIVEGGVAKWSVNDAADVAKAVKAASAELGIPVEWGGDWSTFKDAPHFQLPWGLYPGDKSLTKSRTMGGLGLISTGVVGGEGADGIGSGLDQIAEQLAPAAAVSDRVASIVAIVKGISALLVVGGILWAAYARWDDAGRPLPAVLGRLLGREVA